MLNKKIGPFLIIYKDKKLNELIKQVHLCYFFKIYFTRH
jgi:hypothetical protein